VRVTKHTPKGQMSLWTLRRAGARNECLDCTVMTLFCADKVGLQKKTRKEWDLLEAIIQPNQNDLFALPVEPPGPRFRAGRLPDPDQTAPSTPVIYSGMSAYLDQLHHDLMMTAVAFGMQEPQAR
jgi:hypothetical protein